MSLVVVLDNELKVPSVGKSVNGARVVGVHTESVCIVNLSAFGSVGVLVEYGSPSVEVLIGPQTCECEILDVLRVVVLTLSIVEGLVVPHYDSSVEHRKVDVTCNVVESVVKCGVFNYSLVPARERKVEVGEPHVVEKVRRISAKNAGRAVVREVTTDVVVVHVRVNVGGDHRVEALDVCIVAGGGNKLEYDLHIESVCNCRVSHCDSLVKLVLSGFLSPFSRVLNVVSDEDSELLSLKVKILCRNNGGEGFFAVLVGLLFGLI